MTPAPLQENPAEPKPWLHPCTRPQLKLLMEIVAAHLGWDDKKRPLLSDCKWVCEKKITPLLENLKPDHIEKAGLDERTLYKCFWAVGMNDPGEKSKAVSDDKLEGALSDKALCALLSFICEEWVTDWRFAYGYASRPPYENLPHSVREVIDAYFRKRLPLMEVRFAELKEDNQQLAAGYLLEKAHAYQVADMLMRSSVNKTVEVYILSILARAGIVEENIWARVEEFLSFRPETSRLETAEAILAGADSEEEAMPEYFWVVCKKLGDSALVSVGLQLFTKFSHKNRHLVLKEFFGRMVVLHNLNHLLIELHKLVDKNKLEEAQLVIELIKKMEAGTANKYRELFYLFHQEGQLDPEIAETILDALAANNQNALITSMAKRQLKLVFEQKGTKNYVLFHLIAQRITNLPSLKTLVLMILDNDPANLPEAMKLAERITNFSELRRIVVKLAQQKQLDQYKLLLQKIENDAVRYSVFRELLNQDLEDTMVLAPLLLLVEDAVSIANCGRFYIKRHGWDNDFVSDTVFPELLARWGTVQATMLLTGILRGELLSGREGASVGLFDIERLSGMLKALSNLDLLSAGLVMREAKKNNPAVYAGLVEKKIAFIDIEAMAEKFGGLV